jgi:hypothetical protein
MQDLANSPKFICGELEQFWVFVIWLDRSEGETSRMYREGFSAWRPRHQEQAQLLDV